MGWFGIISQILGLGDKVAQITESITNAKIAAIKAGTEEERIAAEERVKGLEFRRDVLVAELQAGSKISLILRVGLTVPVIVILWKIYIWDKAFGQWTGGRTDALDPNLWYVIMVQIGFYFLAETARIVKRK